jgi:hypothetical protein
LDLWFFSGKSSQAQETYAKKKHGTWFWDWGSRTSINCEIRKPTITEFGCIKITTV